jgi:hypothetical protein
VDAQNLKVVDLQNKGDNAKTITKLGATLVEQEALQCKFDFHVLMLENFKGLLATIEVDHVRVLAKMQW